MAPVTPLRSCDAPSPQMKSGVNKGQAAPQSGSVGRNGGYCHPDDFKSVPMVVVVPGSPNSTLNIHTVRTGETLWTISKDTLGSPHYWRWIAEINGLNPSQPIFAGMRLRLNLLSTDWEEIVGPPQVTPMPTPSSQLGQGYIVQKTPPPEANQAARPVSAPEYLWVLGTSNVKIDPDLGLIEQAAREGLGKEGVRPFTELPAFPIPNTPFQAQIRLRGSFKVIPQGTKSTVTFTLAGMEKEARGVAREIFGGGALDVFKLRFDPIQRRLSVSWGMKLSWGPAEFSVDIDVARRAVIFTGWVKTAQFSVGNSDVVPKIGIEVAISRRDRSFPNDPDFMGEGLLESREYEASVVAALAVAVPVAFVIGAGVSAAASAITIGEGAISFAAAAARVGRLLPVAVRTAAGAAAF